jgi:hypothetical protein
MAHACQKRPNLHTNSSNKLLFYYTCIRIAVLSTPERAKTGDSSTPSFKGCLGNNKFTYILNNDK